MLPWEAGPQWGLPMAIGPFLAGAVVLPVQKPNNGGIRPVARGGILRRLVSKIAVGAVLPSLADYFSPLQGRSRCSRGGSRHHSCRFPSGAASRQRGGLSFPLLEFKNAFNLVSRIRLMEQATHFVRLSWNTLKFAMAVAPTCLWGNRWWKRH
jgi:hypothetical protein